MTTIAQPVVGNFRDQRAGFRTAYVDCGQKVLVLCSPCLLCFSLGNCRAGFAAGLTVATDFNAGLGCVLAIAALRGFTFALPLVEPWPSGHAACDVQA